jgi:hypothetical protein
MRAPNIAILLPSAVRTATQNVSLNATLSPQYTNLTILNQTVPTPATAVIAYLNVTAAPGVETLVLRMQERDPVSLTWSDVTASSPQVATGLIKLVVGPSVAAVAATVTGVTANTVVPPIWRLVVTHSAASNWTYSLAVAVDA